jgi:hypothetical protein
LAINNAFFPRFSWLSTYFEGNSSLKFVKIQGYKNITGTSGFFLSNFGNFHFFRKFSYWSSGKWYDLYGNFTKFCENFNYGLFSYRKPKVKIFPIFFYWINMELPNRKSMFDHSFLFYKMLISPNQHIVLIAQKWFLLIRPLIRNTPF